MTAKHTLDEQIATLEHNLDLRRESMANNWRESRATLVAAKARWTPLLAVGAAVLVGLELGRRRSRVASRGLPSRGLTYQARPFGPWLAAGAIALRLALSPEGQALWRKFRETAVRVPN